jgi:hypothetical protein
VGDEGRGVDTAVSLGLEEAQEGLSDFGAGHVSHRLFQFTWSGRPGKCGYDAGGGSAPGYATRDGKGRYSTTESQRTQEVHRGSDSAQFSDRLFLDARRAYMGGARALPTQANGRHEWGVWGFQSRLQPECVHSALSSTISLH